VPIFIERFVLPSLAAILIGGFVINALKIDLHQRIALSVCVISFAYFLGYSLNKQAIAAQSPVSATAPSSSTTTFNGNVESKGNNSPNIINNQGTVTVGTTKPEKDDKK
jgi:hypothetical protein